jgi:hypothetical protein
MRSTELLTSCASGAAVALPGEVYERTSHGFRLTLHGRRYDVMGVAREATQLKAIVKAQGDPDKGNELRAPDLFSARSRDAYACECANLFGVGETIIKADLARIVERIEALHQEAPNWHAGSWRIAWTSSRRRRRSCSSRSTRW